jgi:hypothetical protein
MIAGTELHGSRGVDSLLHQQTVQFFIIVKIKACRLLGFLPLFFIFYFL